MAIKVATPNEFASQYIANGTVKIEGFDVETGWENGAAAYTSAFTSPIYDVTILPLSNFLVAMDKGLPLVGLPVWIDLFSPQMAVRVNKQAGISRPKDLEGKNVGVRGYGFNPAVWERGILKDLHGVDFTKIKWKAAEPNSMSHVEVRVHPAADIEKGSFDFTKDLDSGKLDAVFWDRGGPATTDKTANLYDDPLAETLRYFKQSGVFPLNSMLLAKRDVLDANPGLADAIVDAHNRALDVWYANLRDDDTYMGMPIRWLRDNGLFPFQHGLGANRKALETIIRYANEQGLIRGKPELESLFYEGAR